MNLDQFRGCLIGLAVGDALGTTVEFEKPGNFEPITDMVGGGPFDLKPGQWTDDTSMALCLAESLIECNGFNPVDQMERYVQWWRNGYLSSTGHCFDIGNTTAGSLIRFEQTHQPYCGTTSPHSAGNGSLMRLAPIPMFYYKDENLALQMARDSSRTTHGAQTCLDCCMFCCQIIVNILNGESDKQQLKNLYCSETTTLEYRQLMYSLRDIEQKNPPHIKGSGYVIKTLEAALWGFYKFDSFEEGCLAVVNLGDDADTTAAVYGQIAGAYYGERAIPDKWREKITKYEQIKSFAEQLAMMSPDLSIENKI